MKRLLALAIASVISAAQADEGTESAIDSLIEEHKIERALDVNAGAPADKTKPAKKPNKEIDEHVNDYLGNDGEHKLYREDTVSKKGEDGVRASMRAPTIKETGLAFGAQAGLHWRYEQINKLIDTKYRGRLDQVSFRPFILEGRILMPSILVVKNDENYLSDTKLVESNISFKVDEEARIVSVPPTYRNYLVRNFDPPRPVNPILKPTTEIEEKLWRSALKEGFEKGVEMADDIFNDGLLKMEQDLRGRVNYRKMMQLGMVSPAALRVTERGVTFNDRTMNVGETIFEITKNANYTSMDEWRSAWIDSTYSDSKE